MEKKILKPNGLDIGVFVISIDDGYVEYSYHIKPEESCSISEVHKCICCVLGAKKEEGKIRIDDCEKLQAKVKRLQKQIVELKT